ncbi:hypothetical protein RP726_02320 [Candidatus Methylospira mobilis]|nr:hypothetical protein [Candidatus Methylospira mobilis]WNV05257.1 hypothetical protein RP726_02320 [Candidatus Methylospira mobilis]
MSRIFEFAGSVGLVFKPYEGCTSIAKLPPSFRRCMNGVAG